MDVRKKLVELFDDAGMGKTESNFLADQLIANGVTVNFATDNNVGGKSITNADRIREMSDEELATHLYDIGWDCHLCAEHIRLDNEPLMKEEKCDERCAEHCLEWLRQRWKRREMNA